MSTITYTAHDEYPTAETKLVDEGLGQFNDTAAPLHEVRRLACFARTADGQAIGGAIGRHWGEYCELQQLWVDKAHRGQGMGTKLVEQFEAHAYNRGCVSIYLESFSFQSPRLYMSLGYVVQYERNDFPAGVVKYHMTKVLG